LLKTALKTIMAVKNFLEKMTKNEKINLFRASINLVHKSCGQAVDNHVNKQTLKRHNNNLYLLPIFWAVYLSFKISNLPIVYI